eukprot:gnl/TRDRNA2_/TRDRNA2_165746_c0_seq2.p1 gnl/TRDRNA2_/TRDRNA2_165746_c0~~gnl/TRDRNA2_/TRDRNA2_165746_c0_seq2.p1  ORF type:complete len:169 (+),score=17.49 gnl/TRDRNA2_/TRDRNA2_165746_c0_seq2:56-562(+)
MRSRAHRMFDFQYPARIGWGEDAQQIWSTFKRDMTRKTATKKSYGFSPLIAMNGDIPCAAALYTDPYIDYTDWVDNSGQTSFVLYSFVRNVGKKCVGSGAAIMCYLIRNSRNKAKEFRPLKIQSLAILEEPSLKSYFASFGCGTSEQWWSVLDKAMYCDDPKPKKCEQ